MKDSYVIVGANLAGGSAAQALRKEGYDGRIVLIGAEEHPPYERPPLSKDFLLKDCRATDSYLLHSDDWNDLDVDLRLGTKVVRVDVGSGGVELADGARLRADKVLLCTGGRVRRIAVPGSELAGVHYLRTIEDAMMFKCAVDAKLPVVVVGGGFIGMEVAASARLAGCAVTLLEAGAAPLSRVLGRELGGRIGDYHREQGLTVLTNTTLQRIEGENHVCCVVTSDGKRIEAGAVVIGIGITPADDLAREAGIKIDNGIAVDSYCETSVKGVFAAGDATSHPNAIFGARLRLENWKNAREQAAVAAASMLGRFQPYCEVPWFWSDQGDLNIQASGLLSPGDQVVYRGDPESQSFSAFFLNNGVLRGAVGINRGRDIKRTLGLIRERKEVNAAHLSDEGIDLRSLTRTEREV